MSRLTAKRVGLAVVGGLASVAALAVLVTQPSAPGLASFGGLGLSGWMLPLVAGASVGVVAWIVLGSVSHDGDSSSHHEESCEACGHAILDDWRLCPYCGTLVQQRCDSRQDVIAH